MGHISLPKESTKLKAVGQGELKGEVKSLEAETSLIFQKMCRTEPETTTEMVCRRGKSLMDQTPLWAGDPLKRAAYGPDVSPLQDSLGKEESLFLLGVSAIHLTFCFLFIHSDTLLK